MLALVDPYDDEDPGTVEEHLQFFRDPYMRGYAQRDDPKITLARTRQDVDYPSLEEATQPNEHQRSVLWDLRFAILTRLRNPHKIDLFDQLNNRQRALGQQLTRDALNYMPEFVEP